MDIERLNELLVAYADNYDKQCELNENIFEPRGKKEWQEFYCGRARELARLFEENEKLLAEEEKLLEEPLTKETAEAVYNSLIVILRRDCFEICVIAPVLKKLTPFYENTQNIERLIRIYEISELVLLYSPAQTGYLPYEKREYWDKITDMRKFYGEIKDPRGRLVFSQTYYRKSMHCPGIYTFEEGCKEFRDFSELCESAAVKALDGNDEEIRLTAELARATWVEALISNSEGAPEDVRDRLIGLAEKAFSDELEHRGKLYLCDSVIYGNHLQAKVLSGELSPKEAMRLSFEYYKEGAEHLGEKDGQVDFMPIGELSYFDFDFLLTVPLYIIEWAEKCDEKSLPDDITGTLLEIMQSIIYPKLSVSSVYDNDANGMLAGYCFSIAPHLRSREEKEQLFFDLIVRRQLPTYIHCAMVKNLALMIFDDMYRDRPELFSDVQEMIGESELRDFIGSCAVFHDFGKNEIAGVINIQSRKIRDCEFGVIKTHPHRGYDLLYNDPDFSRYKDVILGHHKFYNGKGGYPEDFDNTKSPYRSIIDLITICDCMDAATDVLGRNYKRAKTSDEVLDEFERDKGIRYNPDMVEYIRGSKELRRKISQLISEERIDIAYDIYSEAVK